MIYKCFSRRYLALDKRDQYGLSCLERTKLRRISKAISSLQLAKQWLSRMGKLGITARKRIRRATVRLATLYLQILEVEELPPKPLKRSIPRRDIQSFVDEEAC